MKYTSIPTIFTSKIRTNTLFTEIIYVVT